jgi:transcriptional regulator
MYIPPLFRESDPAFIRSFLRQNAFATLVCSDGRGPIASHLLLEAEGKDDSPLVLCGHMSRENPQWRSFDSASEVLAIFQGPHAYISAGWYSVKSAPTWNYISVHVHGTPRIIEDRVELFSLLKRLVDSNEASYPEGSRYTIESLPRDILDGMMKGIVGFRIIVTRVEAAAKLSQNRNVSDYRTIVEKLKGEGTPGALAIAREMERRKEESRSPRREQRERLDEAR